MRLRVQVHRVTTGADVQPDTDLVAHRPGGQEDGGRHAEQVGDPRTERIDCRVLTALLVADLRRGNGRAHRVDGLGLGVRE